MLWTILLALVFLTALGLRNPTTWGRNVPGIMISLGILGTFCGTYLALYPLDFSPGEMNTSVLNLLDGMKTAFATSLLGMLSAVLYRTVLAPLFPRVSMAFRPKLGDLDGPEQSTEQHLVAISTGIENLRHSIVGDGDSSVVTQIRTMRDETREGFKKLDGVSEAIRDSLVGNLEQLIDDIRDIIGRQLGDSLEKLIASLEKALIEQFGKTFREFNEATQAIRRWQEEHRGHVEELTAAFRRTSAGIATIEERLALIPTHLEAMRHKADEAAEQAFDILGVARQSFSDAESLIASLNQQLAALPTLNAAATDALSKMQSEASGAFDAIRASAERAFPEIRAHLDKLVQSLDDAREMLVAFRPQVGAVIEEMNRAADTASDGISRLTSSIQSTVSDAADNIGPTIKEETTRLAVEFQEAINTVAKHWGENMVAIAQECERLLREVRDDGS